MSKPENSEAREMSLEDLGLEISETRRRIEEVDEKIRKVLREGDKRESGVDFLRLVEKKEELQSALRVLIDAVRRQKWQGNKAA